MACNLNPLNKSMENTNQWLAQHPCHEYLLVLEPHEALRHTILELKKKFAQSYDCPAAVYGKPHITLVSFTQYAMREPQLLHRLKTILAANPSFILELTNFGSLPTHTIYFQISTQVQLVELVKAMRPLQRLMKMDADHKPHFITEPYLTLARKLLPWQYEKGWLEYSHTPFSGRFVATEVLLLRKKQGAKKYEAIQGFGLLNEKKTVTQPGLF